ncbi:MAG: ABC transporter ATP-binding protein [Candidatus Sumerlaeia bacterium]
MSTTDGRILLSLRGVCAAYGALEALHGVSLEVRTGEIVALIGANGAGKSTTLKTISGLVRVTAGDIVWGEARRGSDRLRQNNNSPDRQPSSPPDGGDGPEGDAEGVSIRGMSPDQIAGLGIAHVPEGRRLFSEMSVQENLEMGAFLRKDRAGVLSDMERVFALFPVLRERRRQLAGSLSGGEQQMCAIARGLMARPRLLLLDEPSLGLAPILVEHIFRIIREINEQGVTILLVEQNAQMALSLAHRGYVMATGRIELTGTGPELLHDEMVRKTYLGEQ